MIKDFIHNSHLYNKQYSYTVVVLLRLPLWLLLPVFLLLQQLLTLTNEQKSNLKLEKNIFMYYLLTV